LDTTRASALHQHRPVGGRGSLATISLAALAALAFFVSTALPYLLLDPAFLSPYEPRRFWLLAHVACGGVALLTGPIQLWLGITSRTQRLHRRLGRAYVTAVATGVGVYCRYWLTRQPEPYQAIRRVDGSLIGFVANVILEAVTPEDAAADPAVARAIFYAERRGPMEHWHGASPTTAMTHIGSRSSSMGRLSIGWSTSARSNTRDAGVNRGSGWPVS
jgi:Predicted membrane protein (DUF2306)